MDHSPTSQPLPPWGDLLAVRPMPTIPPQAHSIFLWGDTRVHGVALRSAARAVAAGLSVALIDGDMAFSVAPIVAMAKACCVSPDVFLRRVHLARAFTCWQFTTLLCERLTPLLVAHSIGLLILLSPLTHFFDEDVTFKEAKLLFKRVLQILTDVPPDGPRILLAQTVPGHHTPRRLLARDLLRVVDVGLRLLPAEQGFWAVDVVKPRAPRSHA